jgi:glycosyltransferase involved in cell wall biosynthesis
MKTFQYLAAGRAILAPETPDVAEVLVDGENACLVPPDDLSAARLKLERLLADEESLRKLAEAALHLSRRFTWTRRAEDVLGFLSGRLDIAYRERQTGRR